MKFMKLQCKHRATVLQAPIWIGIVVVAVDTAGAVAAIDDVCRTTQALLSRSKQTCKATCSPSF